MARGEPRRRALFHEERHGVEWCGAWSGVGNGVWWGMGMEWCGAWSGVGHGVVWGMKGGMLWSRAGWCAFASSAAPQVGGGSHERGMWRGDAWGIPLG
eukprot:364403-Chlamydomonas_euryale.AAC.7